MGGWIGHEYRDCDPIRFAIKLRLFESGGIKQPAHGRHTIGGNTQTPGVLPDAIFIGCQVHAIEFVFGDVAMKPLDLRPHLL